MKTLTYSVIALLASVAMTACAVEDDSIVDGDDIELGADEADEADLETADEEITARRVPQDEPSVETPKSRTCYSPSGFSSTAAARKYCKTGIRGAGDLVSTSVWRQGRRIGVTCCYEK